MEKSSVLNNSMSNSIWLDLKLTDGNQDNSKLEIFNNSIESYTTLLEEKLSGFNTKVGAIENNDSVKLDLPSYNQIFDIQNAKKFSKKVQRWKGIVEDISEDAFSAKLIDLTNKGSYEIGEFEKDDISPDDLKLFKTGSVFYWTVGHFMENGQSLKKSEIRFQRLIELDEVEIYQTLDNVELKYGNILNNLS